MPDLFIYSDSGNYQELPPPFFRPLVPNGCRRAIWHDYRSRCIYLITINKNKGIPEFSQLSGIPGDHQWKPKVVMFPIGEIIGNKLSDLKKEFPFISILRRCIMPDHLHFVLDVKESTPIHLGDIISYFKGECSRAMRLMASSDSNSPKKPVSIFSEGYHDRILRKKNQLDRMLRYVSDNPVRRLERIANRSFHRRYKIVTGEGKLYEAYGNIHLLEDPEMSAVKISRKYSDEELRKYKIDWKMTVENGGVLVSPFISASEKRVRDWACDNGGRLIYIESDGFGERYSPKGMLHKLCTEGRLLIVAPVRHTLAKEKCSREVCLAMNALAAEIASGLIKKL